ncbi:hypothetical protein SAMN02745115_00029 [[Eubacterium] yurii]|jgi:hypothetical protein|nr:hypothetical protein SAMN02745115_00029 [[Eubacterium] yurii]
MNSGIIRIQKGYLLIEKAKDTIKSLYETQEIKFDKDQLSLMREKEELINSDINEVKNKVFECEEEIQKIEKEIANIIKKSFNNQKRDPKKVLEINSRKEDLEEKKSEFKREIMVLFLQMDALKEQMQNHKLMYNDMEKKLLQKMSKQNKIIVKYEDKITEMEKKIRKIRRDIDSKVLTLYDKKRQKNIVVMSKVVDGKCSQCGFKLSEEIIDDALNKKIIECPSCARILYMEEDIEENID